MVIVRKYRFSYRMLILSVTLLFPLFSVIYNSVAVDADLPLILGGTVFWGVLLFDLFTGCIALIHRGLKIEPLYTEVHQ